MSYVQLSSPVTCEWLYPDSSQLCGQTFTSMEQFTHHVRDTHLKSPYSSAEEDCLSLGESLSGVCCWQGCSFTSLTHTSPEFITHVLFHPYHMFLKLVGSEVSKERQLSECHMDSSLSNLLPSLEVHLQCCWDKGECGVVFDSVGEFYTHVHNHVTSRDTRTCLWAGELEHCHLLYCIVVIDALDRGVYNGIYSLIPPGHRLYLHRKRSQPCQGAPQVTPEGEGGCLSNLWDTLLQQHQVQ